MIADPKEFVKVDRNTVFDVKARREMITDLEKEYRKSEPDTTVLLKKIERLKDFTLPVSRATLDSLEEKNTVDKGPKTFTEYDSLQNTLPVDKQDGWFLRKINRKFTYNKELREDPSETLSAWVEIFLHKLPYLLFVSLPIFALILKLLYIRRRQFYYVDHAIFAIHHYIFSFILLLLIFLLGTTARYASFEWVRVIMVILIIVWPAHLYIAMLNFYRQGWLKTGAKFVLLNILGFFSLLLLFTIFLFLSVFQN